MAIPRFDEDLAIISKLGDNPGSDNNLTTDAFRAKFDEGPQKIQKYLNDVLIPAAEQYVDANKGYMDANKVDKSHVVNNFTTAEEGFVADARALKVLNDSKLSMDLLWENASPTSDFEAQSISFQLNSGDVLFIRTMSWGQYREFIIVVVEDERKLFLLGDFRATAEHRLCAISKTGIDFGDVANDTHKNIIVPTQIYRFKGGSA